MHWSRVNRGQAGVPILLGALRAQQLQQRRAARPGDVAILLTGRAEVGQWTKGALFYDLSYPWPTPGVAIPAGSMLAGDGWVPGQVTQWLSGRHPRTVFLSTYNRVRPRDVRGVTGELAADGWCARHTDLELLTGKLIELTRC